MGEVQPTGPEEEETPAFVPTADVYELEEALVIRVALPGVIEEDIDVSFGPEGLAVRGELEPPVSAGAGRAVLREWRYGYFERIFELPPWVVSERVRVEVEAGVLEIRLPRKAKTEQG